MDTTSKMAHSSTTQVRSMLPTFRYPLSVDSVVSNLNGSPTEAQARTISQELNVG
jgi:hypothetical protein